MKHPEEKDAARAAVIYGASSGLIPGVYLDAARTLGRILAERGYTLVSGGGKRGVMGHAIEGASEAGGRTVGVLPGFMIERGWAHPSLSEVISTPTMHVRKATMAGMSCAAIALAGGIGTLDELAEMMTWSQLKLFGGPVVIVNTEGFYDPLLEMFRKMRDLGFMRGGVIPATVVSTPEEAVAVIEASVK
ncbi:MAG: TIGR00730 family Rossman fold protein [Duncaniella sp.]|nr:TIGR00730 family Rossman fold protein [Duncaniella sp.]MDE6390697.1 TIGR00730 family Rossman fold protein [Duncaniella sp.]